MPVWGLMTAAAIYIVVGCRGGGCCRALVLIPVSTHGSCPIFTYRTQVTASLTVGSVDI